MRLVKGCMDFRSAPGLKSILGKDVVGEAQGKEAELSERSVAARDVLERIEMRAPTSMPAVWFIEPPPLR